MAAKIQRCSVEIEAEEANRVQRLELYKSARECKKILTSDDTSDHLISKIKLYGDQLKEWSRRIVTKSLSNKIPTRILRRECSYYAIVFKNIAAYLQFRRAFYDAAVFVDELVRCLAGVKAYRAYGDLKNQKSDPQILSYLEFIKEDPVNLMIPTVGKKEESKSSESSESKKGKPFKKLAV